MGFCIEQDRVVMDGKDCAGFVALVVGAILEVVRFKGMRNGLGPDEVASPPRKNFRDGQSWKWRAGWR